MTGYFEHLPPEDEADLAALADGCLTGPRRAELAARVEADPTLAEALERQRTALAMIAAAAEPAPLDLRLPIQQLRAAPPVPRLWARHRRPAIATAPAFAAAATLRASAVPPAGPAPAGAPGGGRRRSRPRLRSPPR